MNIPYNTAKIQIEGLYDGVCTVTERVKTRKPNGSTGTTEQDVYENVPCRLSYSSIGATEADGSNAHRIVQTTKLFLAPDVTINEGSRITVTQHGVTEVYKSSGMPAVYVTHQEVMLEPFTGWA